VQVRRTKEHKGGQWQTGTLKSKRSRRTVPLPPWLAERMHAYLTARHPHADNPTAPLWPSARTAAATGQKGPRTRCP